MVLYYVTKQWRIQGVEGGSNPPLAHQKATKSADQIFISPLILKLFIAFWQIKKSIIVNKYLFYGMLRVLEAMHSV